MMRKFGRTFSILAVFCLVNVTTGQSYRSIERLGLQRTWVSTAQINRNQGGIAAVTLSVNHDPENAVAIFEVTSDTGVVRFGQNQITRNGLLGIEEALRLAEVEVIRKKARGLNPKLKRIDLARSTIFVSTEAGVLQSLDAENGRQLWAVSVGKPHYPTSAAAANDDFVSVVNGSTLYILSRKTGELKDERKLTANPLVGLSDHPIGPSMSADWVFVPCLNGQMEAYSLENARDSTLKRQRPPWIYRSRGEISGSALITPTVSAWCIDLGRLMVCDVTEPEILYRLHTSAAIRGKPAFVAPDQIFVAAENGFVYAMGTRSENVDWEYSTGESIVESPIAIGDDVFVMTRDNRLICLSVTDGRPKWKANRVDRFVSASESRIYTTDNLGRLRVLDRKSGGMVMSPLNLAIDYPVENRETDRIYLATRSGKLWAFSELNSEFPTIHHPRSKVVEPTETTDADDTTPDSLDEDAPTDFGDTTPFEEEENPLDSFDDAESDEGTPFEFGDE